MFTKVLIATVKVLVGLNLLACSFVNLNLTTKTHLRVKDRVFNLIAGVVCTVLLYLLIRGV